MVGVVGIGHVEGITEYWDKEIDVKELLRYEKSYLCIDQFHCSYCWLESLSFLTSRSQNRLENHYYNPIFVFYELISLFWLVNFDSNNI